MESQEKIIKNIKIEDSIILAVTENEKELLRFQIKIGKYDITLRPPSYQDHARLMIEHANLTYMLATLNPAMIYLELESLQKDGFLKRWSLKYAEYFNHNKIIKQIEKIIFKYFDLPFKKKYFRKNATFFDLQKIFAFLCTLDELVKKNAKYVIEEVYQIPLTKSEYSESSMKNTDGVPPTLIMPAISELS